MNPLSPPGRGLGRGARASARVRPLRSPLPTLPPAGGGLELPQGPKNLGADAFEIVDDLAIRKSEYAVAMTNHEGVAPRIGGGVVRVAVDFDDQLLAARSKVGDERADRDLAGEFDAQPLSAKRVPQAPFGFRHVVAKRLGAGKRRGVPSWHAGPSPKPSPQRGEGFIVALALAMLPAQAIAAPKLPTDTQLVAQAAKCKIPMDRVGWNPGTDNIITVYIENDDVTPDLAADRRAGACFEAWIKTLGFKPVVIVNIPEDH